MEFFHRDSTANVSKGWVAFYKLAKTELAATPPTKETEHNSTSLRTPVHRQPTIRELSDGDLLRLQARIVAAMHWEFSAGRIVFVSFVGGVCASSVFASCRIATNPCSHWAVLSAVKKPPF